MLLVESVKDLVISRNWSDDRPPFAASPNQASDAVDPTQRRILDYISAHPGVHLRQICRELGLAMGDVQYHIQRLERDGRINSLRRGLYRFFYVSSLFGDRQREVLSVLTLDTPRELLLSMIEKPDSGQEELARAAAVSQPTVSWHLKRLVQLGIVEKRQSGRNVTYSVAAADAAEIATFIRSYHASVWERWSGRLADIFISYSAEEGDEAKR